MGVPAPADPACLLTEFARFPKIFNPSTSWIRKSFKLIKLNYNWRFTSPYPSHKAPPHPMTKQICVLFRTWCSTWRLWRWGFGTSVGFPTCVQWVTLHAHRAKCYIFPIKFPSNSAKCYIFQSSSRAIVMFYVGLLLLALLSASKRLAGALPLSDTSPPSAKQKIVCCVVWRVFSSKNANFYDPANLILRQLQQLLVCL